MSLRLTSLALLLVALCRVFPESAFGKEIELPKIWEADPATKPEGFYRFFYKLEIRTPNKPEQYKSFLIEEWANLGKSQLRLDILQQPGGDRRTILYYGDTNEVFYYEPFTCHSVGDLNEALYPELVGIFPKNNGSYLKFGIGALWKHAENLDNFSLRFENGRSVESSGSFLPLEYSTSTMGIYQIASTNELRDSLTLFFSSKSNTIDSLCLIWIGSKYTISIVDTPKKLRQPREKIEKAFQLPRGYGCALAQNNNGEQDGPLPMSFISLDPSELRLLRLDVVTSRPIVYENNNERGSQSYDSPDRWRSHSSSVRILSGGYQIEGYDRSYVVFEKQEASADVSSVSELLANFATCRRTTMRRTKIVWDMSNLGSDSRSRYFKLDLGERKCLGYGETESPLDVSVDLRIAPASSEFEHDSPPLMLTLGIELLGTVFMADGYRLIARNQKRADTSEFVWEKREQQFKMKNQHGQVIWEGPVSFVRQYEAASSAAASFDPPQSVEKHIITINFYTRHVDRILARVKVLVAESRALKQSNLLDEIDVSDCLLRLGRARTFAPGAEFVDEIRGGGEQLLDENLAFELEYYSIDEELYETFVASQPLISLKQQLEMDFIRSLVELSDYRLDIMQITRLEVDIRSGDERDAPSWSAKIRGHLSERPSLLNFLRDPGQKFADCEQQQIRSFLKESAKACAESCDHFNCTMFVYCTISSVCDISLDSSSTQPGSGDSSANGGVKISWDPNCALYTRHNLAQSIISPHEMIHRMSEAIRGQREQSQLGAGGRQLTDTIELRLDGHSEGVPVVLAPESIHSSLLHAQQLEDLAELDSATAQLAKIQPLVSMTGLIKTSRDRQEYSVFVRDHKYKKSDDRLRFPVAEANHMSYQECESFCRQNDCASFSHCSLEKVCQISNLKQQDRIEQNIEQEHGCVVLIREWITKFERVSGKPLRPRQTFGSVRVETLDECALSCMERDSPKCRAFYYCPADDISSRASCHLKSNHLLADTSGESADSSPLNSVANLSCDLYARSYMNNFDKFYGKSLPPSGSDSLATIHRGLEAESCASECADKLGKCIGFQVCTMGGTKMGQFVCTTFSTELNANLAPKLEPNPSCTSFLVSPGSELYQLASNKLAEHIQSAIDSARDAMAKPNLVPPAQEKLSTIAIWSLRMLFITIGLALGYGVIYGSRRSVLMRNTRKRISNRLPRF